MKSRLAKVAIEDIKVEDRARKNFDTEKLENLKFSMDIEGLLHTIVVMESEDRTHHVLLAGGRRLEAATQLKWNVINSTVYPYIADIRQRKLIELAENINREDLSYVEQAKLTRDIHKLQVSVKGPKMGTGLPEGHGLADTAELLGKSKSLVHQEIELAEAIDKDPMLAECKNKSEAVSQMYKQKERVYLNELASRATSKTAKLSKPQKSVIDSYIFTDVLDGIRALDAKSINFVEFDPPWQIELRKVVQTTERQDELLRAGKMTAEDRNNYIAWIGSILEELYRVMKDNSWIILWYAMDPWHQWMVASLETAGFQLTGVPALWIKNNGNTRTQNIHLSNYFEPFLYARKGNAMLAKPGYKNTFQFPVIGTKVHPNEKPIEMYMDILKVFCTPGSTILSPCTGSGNCLFAAANLAMPAIGFDLDEDAQASFTARAYSVQPGEYRTYK